MDKENNSFNELIVDNTIKFSESVANMLEAMFGCSFQSDKNANLENGVVSDKNFFVSIFFTGMVYGEYLLVLNEEVAASIIGQSLKDKSDAELLVAKQEISAAFSELLNIVVGESIVGLIRVYHKMTLTPPRSFFGSVNYPKVVTGKSILHSSQGSIDCYLYIDRMKLDIASSYKEALVKVLSAHKELKGAMNKLQLQQTILVQSEKMAALGTMAAGVAHEINTPLATVSLIGDNMKSMVGDEDFNKKKFLHSLDMIENTIQRISKITNGMRDFAYGVRNENNVEILVKDLVIAATIGSENVMAKEKIQFVNEALSENLFVECRAPEISQVLFGMIHNSISAVKNMQVKWIKVQVIDLGDKVEIRISDSGAGIPKEILPKIFDPFFTTKDYGQGAGLGLSIAKGVLESHHGQITIDESSAHTCFVVCLPKKQKTKNKLADAI